MARGVPVAGPAAAEHTRHERAIFLVSHARGMDHGFRRPRHANDRHGRADIRDNRARLDRHPPARCPGTKITDKHRLAHRARSVTMYDANYFFVPNPINRYSISPRQNLKTDADGSTHLYIQNQSP